MSLETGNGLYGHGQWAGAYQDALEIVRIALRECVRLEQERYLPAVGPRPELELQYAYNVHLEALHTAKKLRPRAPLSGLPR